MLKIMRQGETIQSNDIVQIPDYAVPVVPTELSELCKEGDLVHIRQAVEKVMRRAEEDSEEAAQATIDQARLEADEMIRQARQEEAGIREEARREGYAAGVSGRMREIDSTIAQVRGVLAEMAREQEDFMLKTADNLRYLAVEIAGKVIQKKLSEDELLLADLVKKVLGTVRDSEWISIELSDQLPRLVESLEKDVHKRETEYGIKRIEIVPVEKPLGTCVLQTSEGLIDASVSTQLENLIAYFNEM